MTPCLRRLPLALVLASLARATCGLAADAPSPAADPAVAVPTAPANLGQPARGRGAPPFGPNLAGQMLTQGDQNTDQKVSREEFATLADSWFDRLDPDRAGRISQEDFLARFDRVLPSPPPVFPQRGGRGGPGTSGSIGFFTGLDTDHDGALTRDEFKQSFARWFNLWDSDTNGSLTREELLAGVISILPRTNLSGATGRETQTRLPGLPPIPPSPALNPAESLRTIRVPDGFKVELAASEPTIEDPIALTFDADGRLYVLEMRSFMLDIDRKGDRDPIGRITRLEDTDGDGRFDKATVFVDQLVVPRALAAVAGGVLYVADAKLYFARDADGDGRADRIELVDADYGRGDIEHGPNGLMRAMDNWIYNGASTWRYRFVDGTLVKQRTEYRGQWGMSQDNYGRLIYNVNDSQLLGDYTPPNYIGRNSHLPSTAGLNLFVATDQRVFPIRMNTAINRGYLRDVLDAEGRAFVFASSCGPVVYRGDNFPAEFAGNAFVCDPAVNLIKRNIVFEQGLGLSSRFAYTNSEFLASTDERFRPVIAYNGPDGALWVVDMYRGIVQYGQFMTAYLRRESLDRGLDQGIHYGRVYRVSSTARQPARLIPLSSMSTSALIERLSYPNGWIRDAAQRLLVERGDASIAPNLLEVALHGTNLLGRIHAWWTIEGLFLVPPEAEARSGASTNLLTLHVADTNFVWRTKPVRPEIMTACFSAVHDRESKIQTAAMRVAESLSMASPGSKKTLLQEIARLDSNTPDEVWFQAALTAGNLAKPDSLPLLARIVGRSTEQLLVRDAVVSGLENWELQFLQLLLSDPAWTAQKSGRHALLQSLANAVIKERQPAKIEVLLRLTAGQPTAQLWRQAALLDGIAANAVLRQIRPIAFAAVPTAFETLGRSADPAIRQQAERIKPLFTWPGNPSSPSATTPPAAALSTDEESRVVQGRTLFEQVCAGCHGLNGQGLRPLAPPLANSDWVLGPETRLIRIALQGVGGPVKVNGTTYQPPEVLPDMPALSVLDDNQIAAILSYIRRDWGHEASPITPAKVAAIRAATQDQQVPWTVEQLQQIK